MDPRICESQLNFFLNHFSTEGLNIFQEIGTHINRITAICVFSAMLFLVYSTIRTKVPITRARQILFRTNSFAKKKEKMFFFFTKPITVRTVFARTTESSK